MTALNEQQREARRTGIGSSDAPAVICGPAFPVYAEKVGIADPPDLDEIEAVEWGNLLEHVIVETYSRRSGREVKYNFDNQLLRHPEHDFMIATLDSWQVDPKRGKGVLEVKNVGEWASWETPGSTASSDWTGDPPLKFQIQLQHQIAVAELEWGTLCALIGGNRMRWFDMDRHGGFIQAMVEKESSFWEQVMDRVPPEPDGSIATRETLKRMYPIGREGQVAYLPEEANGWDESLQCAKSLKSAANHDVRVFEHRFRAAMGKATLGVLPNGRAYTLNTTHRKAETEPRPATSFRVLRRKA